MRVTLLHHTPLWVCATAIRTCWDSHGKSDTDWSLVEYVSNYECGDKDKELIERVGNKQKHSSTLEHLVYSFSIDGISRACLQELARHRMASLSVKSTRYTLKKLKEATKAEELRSFLVQTGNDEIDTFNFCQLDELHSKLLTDSISNDVAKYMLPEAFKTSLVWTINARSLQNFLNLRSSKHALWEIRELAKAVFHALPVGHEYLFSGGISNDMF